ncbi:MAG: signal peptidase I [bacterium]
MSFISSFREWLTKPPAEKSLRRELLEIAGLYGLFSLIVCGLGMIPVRWALFMMAGGIILYWEQGRELARVALVAAIIVFGLIRPFFIQAYYIPSRSMENTLLVNDHIFVNKFIYYVSEPDRWDIVVFQYPGNPEKDYIKRLVAGPGDTVAVRDHRVIVNGRAVSRRRVGTESSLRLLTRPKLLKKTDHPDLIRFRQGTVTVNGRRVVDGNGAVNPARIRVRSLRIVREAGDHTIKEVVANGSFSANGHSKEFGPVAVPRRGQTIQLMDVNDRELEFYYRMIQRRNEGRVAIQNGVIYRNGIPLKQYTVPEDMYFVLGDNRDSSKDSRYWGFVPESRMLGEAMFIYWPPSRLGPIGDEWDGVLE